MRHLLISTEHGRIGNIQTKQLRFMKLLATSMYHLGL